MGVAGSFFMILSPPCSCATATALSESCLRNAKSNGCVLAFPALQYSSASGVTPGEGASGAETPDHTNGFAAERCADANTVCHTPALPCVTGASLVYCDSSR